MRRTLYNKGNKTFYRFPYDTFDGRHKKGDVVRILKYIPAAWNNRYVIVNIKGNPKSFVVSKKRDTLVYLFSSFDGRPLIKTGDIPIIGFLSLKLWKGVYKQNGQKIFRKRI